MSTMAETAPRYVRDVRDASYAVAGSETEASLATKDIVAGVVAAIMTLGPLAATAMFSA